MRNEELRRELLGLVAEDDRVRGLLAADGSLFRGYHAEMEAVHRSNAARLRAIIAGHGWPGRSLVGDDGGEAAFRIAQHAIGEPGFLRDVLPVLVAAVGRGDADPVHAAMLEDRIRVFEGRRQRYGTQYDWDEGGQWMEPMNGIEDPDGLDARRAAVGLGPMKWRLPAPPDEPPPGPDGAASRRAGMIEWAVRTGWRSPAAESG